MRHPRLVQLAALLLCGGLVIAAGWRVPAIDAGRAELNPQGHENVVENAPPEYAFAVQVFGAFRSLITDIAFIRAEQFKEQGRYYDAMQLAKWICQLQPRFPSVWEFASWNMAWNISVTTFTPEERWNWVYNGVKLLRDQGIPLNPRAVNLYKQLAWTYNNKMSETLDEFHGTYKRNWAWRMHLVLGPPPDPYANPEIFELVDQVASPDDLGVIEEAGRVTAEQHEAKRQRRAEMLGQEYEAQDRDPLDVQLTPPEQQERCDVRRLACMERLRPVDEAPATLSGLYETWPETREMVAALRALDIVIEDGELTEDAYWRPDGLAFTFFESFRALANPGATLARIRIADEARAAERARLDRLDEILGHAEGDPAGRALVSFLERKVLVEAYKLDPAHMLELVETFGPIDWRSVDAHSLYWTSQGIVAGGETINSYLNDKTNTTRVLFFSLRNLFMFNSVTFEPLPSQIDRSYLGRSIDPCFMEPLHRAYIRLGRLFDPDTQGVGGAGDTFRSGHTNFLTEIIRRLYLSGLEEQAAAFYRFLQDTYPTTITGQPNPALQKRLHDYVVDSLRDSDEVPGIREMILTIHSVLRNAYSELAKGNTERYVQLVRRAGEFHENYMNDKRNEQAIRLQIPEFPAMQVDGFHLWLMDTVRSGTKGGVMEGARLWRRAPLFLRQSVYDMWAPTFAEACEYWGFDEREAFPEPPGMEEFRRLNPDRFRAPESDPNVITVPNAG